MFKVYRGWSSNISQRSEQMPLIVHSHTNGIMPLLTSVNETFEMMNEKGTGDRLFFWRGNQLM